MISGSLVALVTPMLENGDIDWPALDQLLDWHIESGTAAIVAVGTTGESATLNVDEHCRVIAQVVTKVAGRVAVIAGTGANSTAEAVELTESAKSVGADACLLVTPYYNKPTQQGLYLHYKTLAESVQIPQILYNVPGRTACDMSNDTVEKLSVLPNIVGIKDATGDVARGADLVARCGPDFAIYSGDDATAVDLMLAGAKGNISVTANVAPRQVASVCEAALSGDADSAHQRNEPLLDLHRDLFVESNPIPVKWAMFQQGRIRDGIRLPLTSLEIQNQQTVKDALLAAGEK